MRKSLAVLLAAFLIFSFSGCGGGGSSSSNDTNTSSQGGSQGGNQDSNQNGDNQGGSQGGNQDSNQNGGNQGGNQGGTTEERLVADAGVDKTVQAGTSVTFNASNSTGNITKYEWFEGGISLSTQKKFTKDDFTADVHKIKLVVTNNNNQTASDEVTITVTSSAPVADATPPKVVKISVATDRYLTSYEEEITNGSKVYYTFRNRPTRFKIEFDEDIFSVGNIEDIIEIDKSANILTFAPSTIRAQTFNHIENNILYSHRFELSSATDTLIDPTIKVKIKNIKDSAGNVITPKEIVAFEAWKRFLKAGAYVRDHKQGLEWNTNFSGDTNWNDAVEYCNSLGTQLRLPTVSELLAIKADTTNGSGAYIEEIFSTIEGGKYWASDANGDKAKMVDFTKSGNVVVEELKTSENDPAGLTQHLAICVTGFQYL